MRVNLCNIEIDRCSFQEALRSIIQQAATGTEPKYVVTPNAHHLVTLQRDRHFRNIYQNAFLSVADGVPLLWAAKFLGTPLCDRINGTDLFEELCRLAAENNLSVFLLGGRPEAADQAAIVLKKRHSTLKIAGTYCPPYGFENDAIEVENINQRIRAAKPDILFVGLGAPKQEYWMYQHCQAVNVPVSLGIGVSFEFVAGMVKRAPFWMQQAGLEWLYRLISEPGRLWQRYLVCNSVFVWLVLKQKFNLLRQPSISEGL
ncbi:WecB/TagA/CpsF family glycosyltransferase [Pseudanabaenaceae cyanobacterium LEGE 13415]|nr:WecB/TagA/CpsF family glycosyltransferase [Pseudanabaenaceae cyanobacterium LEGE 13415]